eukprot:gene9575-19898_t
MSTVNNSVKRGKLKLKGSDESRKAAKKRSFDSEISSPKEAPAIQSNIPDDHLTEAQKRYNRQKLELEGREMKKLVQTTYRERVEDFNVKLSKMSEHNDIPRISAAGNG